MFTTILYYIRTIYTNSRIFTMQLLWTSAILFGIFNHFIAVKIDVCQVKEALVTARNESKLNGDIEDWLCLTNRNDFDSYDIVNNDTYGLFQIQYPTWCEIDKAGGICNQNCNDFLDTNLTDDIACAQIIYNTDRPGTDTDGFAFWEIWRDECEGEDLSNYEEECAGIYFPGWQHPE